MRRIYSLALLLVFVVALLGVLMASPASAQEEPWACSVDKEKVCKDVQRGGGRIMDCLERHADQLSPSCREWLSSMRQRAATAKKACGPDLEKFCAKVEPGGGRIVKCLKEHSSELSSACSEEMKAGRAGTLNMGR